MTAVETPPRCVRFPSRNLFLLAAVLTLGLSFIMERKDFRIAYKAKTVVILCLTALVAANSQPFILLWIPVFASFISLTGRYPAALVLKSLKKETAD